MNSTNLARLAIARKSSFQPKPELGQCDDCGHDLTREDWEEYRGLMLSDGEYKEWVKDPKPRCCADEVICAGRKGK